MTKPRDTTEEVRQLRDRLGLTQHEVARVLNVDKSTPARWDQGVHEPPLSALQPLRLVADAKRQGEVVRDIINTAKAGAS